MPKNFVVTGRQTSLQKTSLEEVSGVDGDMARAEQTDLFKHMRIHVKGAHRATPGRLLEKTWQKAQKGHLFSSRATTYVLIIVYFFHSAVSFLVRIIYVNDGRLIKQPHR